MPNMKMTIGIGRAIMQHKRGLILMTLKDTFISILLLPSSNSNGFALRQITPHREFGPRQV
jgi:hypothetical protein